MCFNAEVSLATFIAGTIINIIVLVVYGTSPSILTVTLLWQWVLLMQFFEFLVWTFPASGPNMEQCSFIHKCTNTGAFVANIMQPVVVFCVAVAVYKPETLNVTIAAVAVVAYLCYILVKTASTNVLGECMTCVRSPEPSSSCSGLQYNWWKEISPVPYLLCLTVCIVCLIQPQWWGMTQLMWVFATLVVAIAAFGGAVPSLWCFLAAFAPVGTLLCAPYLVNWNVIDTELTEICHIF